MTESILVGVDGSAPSLAAVRWAAAEAALRGADLSIHCVANESVHGRPTLWTSPQLVRSDAGEVAEQAADLARNAHPELKVTLLVTVGGVAQDLVAAAAGADLLVVGSRGLGAFSAMVLGSVSERAARLAPCPVAVVRGEPGSWTGPVLVGVDAAPESSAAVEFAAAAADRRGVDLVALTAMPPVWPAPPLALPLESGPPHGLPRILRELQEDALQPAVDRHPAVRVVHRVEEGSAAHRLIEASHGSGLLVLGRSASIGPLGSVSGHVLRHAACTVVVVPTGAGG